MNLQKPCNYYDKYIKYKKKYIDYKNKLLDMKGGGIESFILFYTVRDGSSEQNVSSTQLPTFLNGNNISKLYIKILYVYGGNLKFIAYRFIDKAGSGSYGDVYQIEQVEPVPERGSPNFVIKLNTDGKDNNMNEGRAIDTLTNIPPRIKAFFQGHVGNIVFAIYNYLGQDLNTFFRVPANLVGFTQEQYRSLIEQLHTQLYALNSNRQYHNDVKIDNIVIRKTTDRDKYELSLHLFTEKWDI
jgi:serine/threonine protein kinase